MTLKEIILKGLESMAVQVIEAKCDDAAEKAIAALAKMIPGQMDDILLAKYKEEMKAILKGELLKAADKIDGVVG